MSIERQELITRACELGVFCGPEDHTDQELKDAIAAEEASAAWMAEWESRGCPQEALTRLRKQLMPDSQRRIINGSEQTWTTVR